MSTTSTCGSTACTSTSASKRTACAAWSSWVCVPTAPKSWSRWPTAILSPPSPGPRCCARFKDRGLSAPVLAVGDGALGFWAALRDVFPQTREQRCWVHVTANVLYTPPKRLHAQAKDAISAIYSAPSRTAALEAVKAFADAFSDFDKAVKKITGQLDVLLAFFDFPLEHWIHLRTTNPIESTFSTVRLRTKVTRGAGSRKAALAMAYKLLDAAQDRWRRINGHELVPLVRAEATFIDGKLQERSVTTTDSDSSTGSVAA